MEASAPAIVGREEELAAISSFLEARDDLPAALVLQGEPGIGKTTIWRRAGELASERGYRVLSAYPSASEAQLSFAALGDLLEQVFDDAVADLPAPQRRALATALQRDDPSERPPEPTAIGFGILGALRTLSRARPTVLAIDDFQWLDAATAGALRFAVRRLREHDAVALLVAVRMDETPALAWLEEAFEERLRRLSVGPLTLGALHHLLRSRLDASLPRPSLRRVHETAGGNPFFALELARSLLSRDLLGRPDPQLPVPSTLEGLVVDRIADLPAETKEALLVVSAVSNPSSEVIAAALGRKPELTLTPAVDAQLIEIANGRVRFSHPLFAEVIYARAAAAERREVHGRLASLVSEPEARAHHYALSKDSADPEAASALEEAAQLTLNLGGAARAATLLEEARRLTPVTDVEAWTSRSLACAEASARAGDPRRGEQVLREVVERLPAGSDRARAMVELAWWTTDIDLCEQALAEARDDPELTARIASIRTLVHGVRGDYRAMVAAGRDAVASARTIGDERLLTLGLSLLGLAETVRGLRGALSRLEEGERLDEDASAARIYSSPASVIGRRLMWHDDLDAARRRLEAQRQRATELGDEESSALLCSHLAEVECLAGNWAQAQDYAEELATFIDQSGGEGGDSAVGAFPQALLAAYRGDAETASRLAEAGVADAEAAGWQLWAAKNLAVLGFVEVSKGEHARALEWLSRLEENAEQMGVADPGVLRFEADQIEALVGAGRLEEADARIAAFEERGRELERRSVLAAAARCRGLLLAARGDLDGALTELERSVAEHESLPLPLERARTLLALGRTQRRAKQKRAARESLEQALRTFDELGARLWSERCREELARIGGRAPSSGGLTATERRVAELVAEGRPNKEVAAALFVTVKAVEANLSRIYAKLGIRSRAELASRLGRAGKQ